MSLDLLKERFGHSVKKEADNKEKINEKLSKNFNFDLKVQHQEELEEKDNIIENLRQELRDQKLENNIAMNTKKIYEDKIKTMNHVDSTELIPLLTTISRKKQGFRKLTWESWIQIPENIYLFQINENVARQIFENTNNSISAEVSNINLPTQRANLIEAGRTSRTRGGDEPPVKNYSITFTGDSNVSTRKRDYVTTTFDPDYYECYLGFTVSYWVRADERGTRMFAWGRENSTKERFSFGITKPQQIAIHFGQNRLDGSWSNGLDDNPSGLTAAELFPDSFEVGPDDSNTNLKTGVWNHFVVTYANRTHQEDSGVARKVFLNGELVREHASIKWLKIDGESATTEGGTAETIIFGGRNLNPENGSQASYDNGWACSLDEVAIYNTDKGDDFAQEVYNGGTDYDHTGAGSLVGYWKFNDGSGTKVTDYGPYGHHGTFAPIGTTDGVTTTGLPTWEKR